MRIDYDRLLEEYFAAQPDMLERDRTRTSRVIDILIEHKIEQPTENDYQQIVKPEVMKLPRVNSENTADGYITCARKFIQWLSKTGDKIMDLIPTEIETESKNEVKSGKKDSGVVFGKPLNSPEPVQAESEPESMSNEAHEVPLPEQPKATAQRGRPKKAENEQRTKNFSVYLTAEKAEALKDLANYGHFEVSVLIAELIETFINNNAETLNSYREFIRKGKPLKR